MARSIARLGIILRTERFDACVWFYRDLLGLELWYTKEDLVCLRFGTGYLMIEKGGHSSPGRKGSENSPHIFRFDVADVVQTSSILMAQGIEVEVREFDWGTIAAFADPDGNPCELKNADDPFFQSLQWQEA